MGLFSWIKNKYLYYEVVTATYMLDPWEKLLFNFIFFGILFIFSYYTMKVSRPVIEVVAGPEFWHEIQHLLKSQ